MKNKINTVKYTVIVEKSFSGTRLDKFLAENVDNYSRSRIKSLILGGHIASASQKITDPSHRVKPDEVYIMEKPAPGPTKPIGQDIDIDVVYEDDDVIVVDKSAGLVVHPAAGNKDMTLVNALLAHCGNSLSGIGGEVRPGIVHRLDKNTSGLIVAAKNDVAHRGLACQFAAHSIERAYKAVVWGVPKNLSGDIIGNIGRNSRNRKKMAVVKRGGKHAITRYKVKKRIGTVDKYWASLIECRLETGRTHQIRVHLTSIGNPIIGDSLYGSQQKRFSGKNIPQESHRALSSLKRQALHAYVLGFIHPVNGDKIRLTSNLPDEIKALL